jgi:hypothetical protein
MFTSSEEGGGCEEARRRLGSHLMSIVLYGGVIKEE